MTKSQKSTETQLNVERRAGADRRKQDIPVAEERRKAPRRRQIDPTTCERDYSHDEIEFMQALDAYKRRNGRMFPTCSEILEVIRALGYVRLAKNEEIVCVEETQAAPEESVSPNDQNATAV